MFKTWIVVGFILLLVFFVYVRFAPSKEAVWHIDPTLDHPERLNSFQVTAELEAVGLTKKTLASALSNIFPKLDGERAEILAGSAEEGFLTYISRSKLIGFPDYMSVKIVNIASDKAELAIYARSRFGISDLGKNKARVSAWLKALEASLK
ncbi:MAG: DUF1499 domain-containing protein [Pseudomonadota bacterium]